MKKINLDHTILSGLSDVSSLDSIADSEQNLQKDSNPKYCRISLFVSDNSEQHSLKISKTVPDAVSYKTRYLIPPNALSSSEYLKKSVLQVIRDHTQKYGLIEEIRLVGHGTSGQIGEGRKISIEQFMPAFIELEKELHVKITNRIVFDACNTFSHLTDSQIKFYSELAKSHNIQIVGATSVTSDLELFGRYHMPVGRYVQFCPNGKIIRDKLDTRYNPDVLLLSNDRSWTDFYIDHTWQEGLTNKKESESKKQKEIETLKRERKLENYGPKY